MGHTYAKNLFIVYLNFKVNSTSCIYLTNLTTLDVSNLRKEEGYQPPAPPQDTEMQVNISACSCWCSGEQWWDGKGESWRAS